MPRKVSSLALEANKNVVNGHQVVVTDPTNFSLFRVPVSEFRGASLFTSDIAPTETPEDITVPAYHANDLFLQRTTEGEFIFKRNPTNSAWVNESKLNGLRVLTADDFDPALNLDDRTTNFLHDSIFEGDYYLNRKYNILFGGYSAVLGFHFDFDNFEGYQTFRAPTTFTMQGTDALGYDNPIQYLAGYLADVDVSDEDKYRIRRPIHGDNVRLLLEGDEGHEGYWFEFDESIPTTAGDFELAYLTKLGTDGIQTDVKRNWRKPKVWNETLAPVQNAKKYLQDDIVFDLNLGVMYYEYNEAAPVPTTDLGVLFGGQTVLKAEGIKLAQANDGSWVTPTKDDNIYKNGDIILTKEGNTPRLHNYVFGAVDDASAWPLFSVLRCSVEHNYLSTDTAIIAYATDYPYINGTMVVDGDTYVSTYTPNVKTKHYNEGCVIDYDNKNITWGANYVHGHPTRVSFANTDIIPTRDDLVYYEGEIIRNNLGDLFKYVEDQASNVDAFEVIPNLRAKAVVVVETTDGNYVPSTVQGDIFVASDNDTLEVRNTSTGSDKVVLYTAKVDEVGGTIEWIDRRSKYGTRTHQLNIHVDAFKSNDWFTTGDLSETSSGKRFVYDETADGGTGEWGFLGWVRGEEQFIITETNNYVPAVNGTGSAVDFNPKQLKVGDTLTVDVAGSTTGKQFSYDVISENPITLGDRYNPNLQKVHTSTDILPPTQNDNDYSEGDYMDNGVTGWRYGSYVEGAATDLDAWPTLRRMMVPDNSTPLAHHQSLVYSHGDYVEYMGSLYSANKSIDGSVTPVPFSDLDWDVEIIGTEDLRDNEVGSLTEGERFTLNVQHGQLHLIRNP